jgi:hypothetical protein
MTKMSFLSVALVACACSDATAPDHDLVVQTTVVPAEFHAGDQVTVNIVITNTGPRPRMIFENECLSAFEVETMAGTVVGPGERICDAIAVPRVLAAGEQYTLRQQWIGDGLRGGIDQPIALLPAGTYQIVGLIVPPGPANRPGLVTITN